MNEQMKMKILEWAQECLPATAGVLTAELSYQYSDEVEVGSAEMDASIEREMQIWRLMAKGCASYLFGIREESEAYAVYAVKVAQEYGVRPDFDSVKDMVEWHMYSR